MKSVRDILQEIRPEFDFSNSENFIADGMLDSFDLISLVSALEKNYHVSIQGVEIVPENFQNLKTIESLCGRSVLRPRPGSSMSSPA